MLNKYKRLISYQGQYYFQVTKDKDLVQLISLDGSTILHVSPFNIRNVTNQELYKTLESIDK